MYTRIISIMFNSQLDDRFPNNRTIISEEYHLASQMKVIFK